MYLLEFIVFFIKKIRSPFVILLSISWLVIFNIGDKKEKDEAFGVRRKNKPFVGEKSTSGMIVAFGQIINPEVLTFFAS